MQQLPLAKCLSSPAELAPISNKVCYRLWTIERSRKDRHRGSRFFQRQVISTASKQVPLIIAIATEVFVWSFASPITWVTWVDGVTNGRLKTVADLEQSKAEDCWTDGLDLLMSQIYRC